MFLVDFYLRTKLQNINAIYGVINPFNRMTRQWLAHLRRMGERLVRAIIGIMIECESKKIPRRKCMRKKRDFLSNEGCPVEATLEVIGGKWKGILIYLLISDKRRFSELKRALPDVTQRILTKQLRELEKSKVIQRKIYPEIPPRVEYSLTEFGTTLKPIVLAMKTWGEKFAKLDQD
jgi:DNA-binding HxlR family transcriptional regulator